MCWCRHGQHFLLYLYSLHAFSIHLQETFALICTVILLIIDNNKLSAVFLCFYIFNSTCLTVHESQMLMKSKFKKSCYFSGCLGTEGIATLGTSCLRLPCRLQNATAAKDSGKVDKYFFHSCRSVKTPQLWTACIQESTTLKGKGIKSLHCVKLIFCPSKL